MDAADAEHQTASRHPYAPRTAGRLGGQNEILMPREPTGSRCQLGKFPSCPAAGRAGGVLPAPRTGLEQPWRA